MDGPYAFWRWVHYKNLMVQTVQCAFTVQHVLSNFHKITFFSKLYQSLKYFFLYVQYILTQQLFHLLDNGNYNNNTIQKSTSSVLLIALWTMVHVFEHWAWKHYTCSKDRAVKESDSRAKDWTNKNAYLPN